MAIITHEILKKRLFSPYRAPVGLNVTDINVGYRVPPCPGCNTLPETFPKMKFKQFFLGVLSICLQIAINCNYKQLMAIKVELIHSGLKINY